MPESLSYEEAVSPATLSYEEAAGIPASLTYEQAASQVDPRVSEMASATRQAVGIVGRAIAATDLALAGREIPTLPDTSTDEFGRPLDPRGRNPAQAAPEILPSPAPTAAGLTTPFVTLPTADLGIFGPSKANAPASVRAAVGAYNTAKGLPEFLSSPLGAITMSTGGMPALVQRLVAAGYAVDMARHTPEQITALAEAVQSGDPEAIGGATAALGLNVALTGLTAKAALTKVAPLTAEVVTTAPEPTTPTTTPLTTAAVDAVTKGPNASSQQKTATVYGDLRTPAIEGARQVPAEVGSGGIQSQAERGVSPPVSSPQGEVTGPVEAPPTPAPVAATSESGQTPVTAGAPPAKESVTASMPIAKSEGEQALTTPKWTAATRAGVDLGRQTLAGIPDPVATFKAVVELAKEAVPAVKRAGKAVADIARNAKAGVGEFLEEQTTPGKMTDYRRAVLNWSSKLQTSFGEADAAQREIRSAVPDPVRREAITNWIQAGGDAELLQARANATADAKLRAGYEAALTLTPDELKVANDVRAAFEELGARGDSHGVLGTFIENYVPQTWDLGKGPSGTGGGSRTLKEKFRFSKARTFQTYFEGEQAGYTPKTKDIAKLLPMYLHEMNSVIAARQLVQEMAGGVASDGRPLLAPRGGGVPVEEGEGKATLIMPKMVKGEETADYKVLQNQPALTDWRWASKDSEGNPVFLKADLALHPEAYNRLKNVLGKSAIKEWYQTRTTAAAQIPKALMKAVDVVQGETKRTMLGFFAPFHQVQEGTHAVGHRVNPLFSIPKIDLVNDAAQRDATKHGLMLLPDRQSADQFMEGFRHSGLVSAIPKIGPAADWYSHYLFQQYIPGLKFKTYEHILERNQKVYAQELADGSVRAEDIKVLSAEQTNAAYGHLNYSDLARNPTIQHGLQLFALAPDFFEARARFAGQAVKGLAGGKVGREQILALATLAVAQATTAWIAAQTTGGTWDAKHPFEMVLGDRRYSMRSVPEDIAGLTKDARKFFYSRLSPLVGKGIIQGLSGVDYKGDKVSAGDTAKELAQAPIPLPLRGFLGTSHRNLTAFEELAGSMGLRISRYLPEPVTHAIQLNDEVDLWINRSKKLDTDEERANYLKKQLEELSAEDRKKAVIRLKQHTSKAVRQRIR